MDIYLNGKSLREKVFQSYVNKENDPLLTEITSLKKDIENLPKVLQGDFKNFIEGKDFDTLSDTGHELSQWLSDKGYKKGNDKTEFVQNYFRELKDKLTPYMKEIPDHKETLAMLEALGVEILDLSRSENYQQYTEKCFKAEKEIAELDRAQGTPETATKESERRLGDLRIFIQARNIISNKIDGLVEKEILPKLYDHLVEKYQNPVRALEVINFLRQAFPTHIQNNGIQKPSETQGLSSIFITKMSENSMPGVVKTDDKPERFYLDTEKNTLTVKSVVYFGTPGCTEENPFIEGGALKNKLVVNLADMTAEQKDKLSITDSDSAYKEVMTESVKDFWKAANP
ncbi:MAG: hypothetical protein KDK76_06905 [Chlamydiia bacterium]|nr:hypothetical protein [Chlamydiia bacterium]